MMYMKKIKAIWELMRLEHGVMLFLGIIIGSFIALKGVSLPSLDKFILTFFTALFLEASTFALNDYFDLDIDILNKRNDRPLVRGDIKPKTALILFGIFFPLGIIFSYFVNIACFVIALITALFAVLYDSHMKKIKFIGNFYIAYVMAIPFVFGGVAVIKENTFSFAIDPSIYIIALIAFLAGSGREIMKDVQDFEGDKKKGTRSLPKFIGERKSNIIAGLFLILAVCISFIPFLIQTYTLYYMNYVYLFLVLICDILLLIIALNLIFKKQQYLKFFRKISLFSIFIGLLAFLISIFVNI